MQQKSSYGTKFLLHQPIKLFGQSKHVFSSLTKFNTVDNKLANVIFSYYSK